jgi:hypothetical protein
LCEQGIVIWQFTVFDARLMRLKTTRRKYSWRGQLMDVHVTRARLFILFDDPAIEGA